MRKKKSFTTAMLERFIKNNRSMGIKDDFRPWHQVTRSDPSSIGRSGRYVIDNRQVHTLSTVEYTAVLFATMSKDVVDIREQFALNLDPANHELNAYDDTYGRFYPGTLEIARALGIKHPLIQDGSKKSWRMTTDILITLNTNGVLSLIAVSCKTRPPENRRTKELLLIEKEYWRSRGVEWLLFTPDIYERGFANTLRSFRKLALSGNAGKALTLEIVEELNRGNYSYAELIVTFLASGHSIENIQNAFWNGFWFGDIPMEVRVRFEPMRKIRLISKDEFLLKNPIYSRRSSWI